MKYTIYWNNMEISESFTNALDEYIKCPNRITENNLLKYKNEISKPKYVPSMVFHTSFVEDFVVEQILQGDRIKVNFNSSLSIWDINPSSVPDNKNYITITQKDPDVFLDLKNLNNNDVPSRLRNLDKVIVYNKTPYIEVSLRTIHSYGTAEKKVS